MKNNNKKALTLIATVFLLILLTGSLALANGDDTAVLEKPIVTIWDAYAFESGGNIDFYIGLWGSVQEDVIISYCTISYKDDKAEAGKDYESVCDEVVTFSAASGLFQVTTISIPLINDDDPEDTESFKLKLETKNENVELRSDSATAWIEDDDKLTGLPRIGFTRKEVEVPEDIGILKLEVKLSKPAGDQASVKVKLKGENGQTPDVILTTDTIEFDAGSRVGMVELEIIHDDESEEDESIEVELSKPENLRLSAVRKIATVTIIDRPKRKKKIFLPLVLTPGKWEAVAKESRPDTDGFERFYGIAQCSTDSNNYIFAGGNNGLYQLMQQDDNVSDKVWVKEDVPESTVNNVVFYGTEKCTELYAAVLGGGQINDQAGVWKGTLAHDLVDWSWEHDSTLDMEAADSTWSLIIYQDLLLIGTQKGLRWKSLADDQDDWHSSIKLGGFVTSLATDNQGMLLATVWDEGVYKSASADIVKADEWEKIAGGPENRKIYQADGNSLGLATGTQTKLFYQSPEGEWGASNMGEFEERTYAVLAAKSRMYAGLRSETILFSDNGGKDWAAMPVLPDTNTGSDETFQVRGFHIGTDGMLYAGTSSGVWMWSGSP